MMHNRSASAYQRRNHGCEVWETGLGLHPSRLGGLGVRQLRGSGQYPKIIIKIRIKICALSAVWLPVVVPVGDQYTAV